jgi:hypothetical protein
MNQNQNPIRLCRPVTLFLAVFWIATPLNAADDSSAQPGSLPEMDQAARDWLDSPASEAFGKWLVKALDSYPDHPEWLAMFADILQGSHLGPPDGWFRKAVAQTRYDWKYLFARYDRDGDGVIQRDEFPGSQADFDRLDRNSDNTITASDLAWPDHALASSPGSMLYSKADADSDGRVTREEWLALFDKADPDKTGFLSLDDLRALLPKPAESSAGPSTNDPSKSTLIRGLFHQEIGALKPGPAVGDPAPDFTLKTVDGSREFTLSEQIGPKPVVLIFGNITCRPFRSQGGNIEKLYKRYLDRANFLMVYVREAHPADGWRSPANDAAQITLEQPKTYEERVDAAETCQLKLGFEMPFLVDTIDDRVGGTYSGMPSRLYVIDRTGKIVYKSGRGPFGFKPAEMEQSLIWALTEQAVLEQAATASVPQTEKQAEGPLSKP